MQNYFGTEPELDIASTIRRGLLGMGTDSGASKVQPKMPQEKPPSAMDNLLNMAKPMTPNERSIAEHGKGGHIARSIGGFLLGDSDMFTKDAYKDQYKADKARYGAVSAIRENMPAFREYDAMLRDDDPSNDAEALYMMNKTFGADDKLMKQMYGEYGDRGVSGVSNGHLNQMLKGAGTTRSDFDAMPKPAQEAFLYENGTDEYRAAVDATQGLETPESARLRKEAELYGSGVGQQLAADREMITGAQSKVEMLDTSANKIKDIRTILEGDADAAGWSRIFRDTFNINTETDGVLSEAEASGVVEQIKQATFGAISQAELDLLRQALMDPTKSSEFNIGTLSSALKTVQDKRKQTISDGRQAVDRYSASDTQKDFDKLMESDWAYNNLGAGSRVESIPAFGGAEEVTYQGYVKERIEALGPFDKKPSRDDLITGFAEERAMAEEAYEIMIREEEERRKAAEKARERLSKPFGTKK